MGTPSNSDQWARLEELFHQAHDLESDDLQAFLDRVCSGDPGMRRQLESLMGPGRIGLFEVVADAVERLAQERD